MKAVVIGGGIGGLAAAIGLRRIGIDVEVFERADVMRDVGAGLSLWANALHALDELGLGAAIAALDAPDAANSALRSWRGRTLSAGSDALQRQFGVVARVFHRAELLDTLREHLNGAPLHLAAPCVRVHQDADAAIAEFADGRVVRADLLIGADGLHSVVRTALHGSAPPTYSGYTAWRSVVPFDVRQVQAGESWGRGMRFGQVPMSAGRVYWFATKNVPEGDRAPSEKAEMLRVFRGWHAPIESLIEAADDASILRNDIYDRPPLTRWGAGRITLLGDAAHPMTPNLGQGACQALEDAVVLAKALATSTDVATALRAYESARIPRANAIVLQSRRIGQIGQWQNPLAVGVRDGLIRGMMALLGPDVQAKQLAGIVGYRV